MTKKFSQQHGFCSCNANTFNVNAKPIARFVCHCTICQAYTGKASSDVTVLLAKDVNSLKIENTRFKRWKLPPNIRRGTCTKCNKPVIEFGVANQLAFVPTANYEHPEKLPPASMHIFYHSRVGDSKDAIPKYSGFVKSQVMLSAVLMQGLYERLAS